MVIATTHILREKGELIIMKFNLCMSLSLLLFSLLVFPSYAKTPQEARNELAQMNITYSEDEFLYCAEKGKTDAVKLFLDAGMNPNVKDNDGWTALLFAEDNNHLETVKTLLAKGADINARDTYGNTALMYASIHGHTDIVQVLLTKDADVNAKTKDGKTALMYAIDQEHDDIVSLLKNAGAIGLISKETRHEPVKKSLQNSDDKAKTQKETKKELSKQNIINSDNVVKTPEEARKELAQINITFNEDEFINCAKDGKTDVVKLFLDAGMNPNAKDSTGTTALISATFNAYTDTVQALLTKGVDVNTKDNFGRTALMYAAYKGQMEIVKALLSKSADVKAMDEDGWSALMWVTDGYATYAMTKEPQVEVVSRFADLTKVLIAAGADLDARAKKNGQTALDLADTVNMIRSGRGYSAIYPDLATILINAGAKRVFHGF